MFGILTSVRLRTSHNWRRDDRMVGSGQSPDACQPTGCEMGTSVCSG